ncbi:arginine utilization protein RocB [Scopulibacillus darangshiensis]|uniref:Arginine utilization protein RocB n=1 Tax=Scopulibacillus darangshiensis TaxID=442528 RepID=A0A4R2P8J9_9BACL|nr:M20/M25/M40 family metallo-hydrolase [Scopulibacillus darangshiensis]TCP31310.1 arginine utilization protein RocB [Scopulibacillus darangshiensis]
MYNCLKGKSLREQIEYLTKRLVEVPSVNRTEGEAVIAEEIKQWIASFPYFHSRPGQLWEQAIRNDPLGRKNVFALIEGKDHSSKTVVYHAHIDTVDIKDFGAMEDIAFNPDALLDFFKGYQADPKLQAEAQSGEWLFGRGALDMQSGAAVHLANLLYFSEHLDELSGNLLVMFNPDEETQHQGIIAAISELKRLQDEYGYDYIAAINDDFTSPLHENDQTRYIYTGAAGKLLPSFYIYGRETHVGETLKGIDATLISSELNGRINNNMALVDNIRDEVIMPPSCLHQRDGKAAYNVQTPFKSCLYFNYFLYEDSPKDVIEKLKRVAIDACLSVEEKLEQNYKVYLERSGEPKSDLSWHIEVNTLEEYVDELDAKGINVQQVIEAAVRKSEGLELRDRAFQIVEALQQQDFEKKPRVILFFAPPHLPHSYLRTDQERDSLLYHAVQSIADHFNNNLNDDLAVKRFFPFLSDSSYLALYETDEELDALIRNFSGWQSLYSLPVKEIRALGIPSINLGVYGKDAHKWTERVHKPYSFETLPRMIRMLTCLILEGQAQLHQEPFPNKII